MDLSLQLQTAYQDLLQHHLARPNLLIDGSIIEREKAGRKYWATRKRAGDRIVEVAIGPDNEETRATIDEARRLQAIHQSWARVTAANVAMLRAGKCLAPDMQSGRVLAALSEAGFFRAGGVLGGTQAFRHYPMMLGVDPPQMGVLQTGDIDLLAPSALRLLSPQISLSRRIMDLGIKMEAVHGMTADAPRKWRVEGVLDLEFLSTVRRGGAASWDHPGIGEKVQALKFLDFSIESTMDAVSLYRTGVLVKIPAPERYALHKLIVANLRSGTFREKREKDIEQAAWLIDVLAERRGYELWEAWTDLRSRGTKWRQHADASLLGRNRPREALLRLEEVYGSPVA